MRAFLGQSDAVPGNSDYIRGIEDMITLLGIS